MRDKLEILLTSEMKSILKEALEQKAFKGNELKVRSIATLKTEADCKKLNDIMLKDESFKSIRPHGISPRSLKQILGLEVVKADKTFLRRNIDALAVYLEYDDWDDFVDKEKIPGEEYRKYNKQVSSDISMVDSTRLEVGETIKLELSREKYSILKHLDDYAYFEVVEMRGMMKTQGTKFWALGFEVVKDKNDNQIIKLTDHDNGWFDEPDQKDLKDQKDYFIL